MGYFDSFTVVMAFFLLLVVAALSEILVYIGNQMFPDNPWFQEHFKDFEFFPSFIKSNLFIFAFAIVLTNVLIGARSTLNPIYFGLYVMMSFIIIWLLNNYLLDVMVQTLVGLQDVGVSQDWSKALLDNWYWLAISGILGTIVGYVRGAKL